jgi:hypothetical protein
MLSMLLAEDLGQALPRRGVWPGIWCWRACCATRYLRLKVGLFLMLLSAAAPALGAGGKVLLTRKYHSGQSMVYVSNVHTNSKIDSDPPDLRNFFPPLPAELRLNQQSTVTVSKVQPDGAADVVHRFDKFEVQSDLRELPENIRDSIVQAQEELSQRMVGQTLTAHYDRDGRLLDIEGADSLFRDIDAPVREPLLQMLRMFMEQMGGQSLYPNHRVKVGEEWSQTLDAQPLKDSPFQVLGKSTLRYSGKTRYRGVKAAVVDYHFENVLKPGLDDMRKGKDLPQLEAMGVRLDIQISGKGQGRILVALDDGRVLQNHSTLHQTLSALMKNREGLIAPSEQSPRLEIQSDTEMTVEGNNSKRQKHQQL